VINVRHYLTPSLEAWGGHIGYCVAPTRRNKGVATRMLAAVLEPCRQLKIERALLTCDSENVASWKTIEANGGALDREDWCELGKCTQRWYWIDLTS
jgi:predicted acetyltransferase